MSETDDDTNEIKAALHAAFDELREQYYAYGGWRYPGSLPKEDGYGYMGPWAWSEGDYQYKLARLLEDQPGLAGHVHTEFPLRPSFRDGLDLISGPRGTRHIDIVVTDFTAPDPDDPSAGDRLRSHTHSAFIEVKWSLKSTRTWRSINWRDFNRGVSKDVHCQSKRQREGWCKVAAMLIVDDSGWHACRIWTELDLPDNVEYLVLVPPCPACASGDALPIVWGYPTPQVERAAAEGRVALGGCLVSGDEPDPAWECRACSHQWG